MYSNVTLEMIEQKVREIAKRNPKKVYAKDGRRKCAYRLTRNEATHRKDRCIFGQAFSELGVDEISLTAISSYSSTAAITDLFGIELNETTQPRLLKLRQVQRAQDGGASWGSAVEVLG
jgi:hypothetical protein